jgi:predicted ribosomally synthesized peptide with nif11-like leader
MSREKETMPSRSLEGFNAKIAESPELQKRVEAIQSAVELIALAQEQVQTAFHYWLTQLDQMTQTFFDQAQAQPDLNQKVKTCQSPAAVIAVAKEHGFDLAIADLQQAAIVARRIPGFSFEKLWFKNLGL